MKVRKIKQIGKRALSLGLAALTAGYIVAVPKQVNAQTSKPSLEVKVEDVFDYNKRFMNDKLRTTVSYDKYLFRLDKNEGRQSQYMFTLKAVNQKNTKLILIHGGGIGDSNYSPAYTFGAAYSQNLGKIPILGETTLNLSQKNTFIKGGKTGHRGSVKLYGENLDLAYKTIVSPNRDIDLRYYAAYHNDYLHASLGKTKGRQIEGVLVTKDNPNLGLFVIGNYDLESRVLTFTLKNAFKNRSNQIYNQQIGRLASNIFTLGTVEVNFPIFSSYLTLGDITNNLYISAGPKHYRVEGEVGARVGKNLGVGGGVLVEKEEYGALKVKPIISGYFRTKVLGQDLHFQASLKDGKVCCYTYTQVRF